MKFRKLENPMETININGFEIEPDEVFEVYDHSIDTIDPDESDIPGPDPETYGYNDPISDAEAEWLEEKVLTSMGV